MYKAPNTHRYVFQVMKNGKWEQDGMITAPKIEYDCKRLMAQLMRQFPLYEGLKLTAKGKPAIEMIRKEVPVLSIDADDEGYVVSRKRRRSR